MSCILIVCANEREKWLVEELNLLGSHHNDQILVINANKNLETTIHGRKFDSIFMTVQARNMYGYSKFEHLNVYR